MGYFDYNEEEEALFKEHSEKREAALAPYAAHSKDAVRAFDYRGDAYLRTPYSIDVDKILHNVLYNRYTDKTQVFSFYKNDDITRRALHVQLVSRLARLIGAELDLNLDLIEAIALGHDIGHTPFGHVGEAFLNRLYHDGTKKHAGTGRFFNHNVHSVRNLMNVTPANLTLQTYDGILCHNGEKNFDEEYYPSNLRSFEEFGEIIEKCYTIKDFSGTLHPSTLEGCVVRICDILAYVAKDRQDARKIGLNIDGCFKYGDLFKSGRWGDEENSATNGDVISCVIRNIVKNSYGKPYIKMDKAVKEELIGMRNENGPSIYGREEVKSSDEVLSEMMEKIYDKLLEDILNEDEKSVIYTEHISNFKLCYYSKKSGIWREGVRKEDVVVDYIASMTDDYLIDLFKHLFPEDELCNKIRYVGYFEGKL